MADLKLNVTDAGVDLQITGGDLALDLGIESSIYAAVFCDRRADPTEIEPDADPRGYFGDAPGRRFGSKLWLLERSKRTPATMTLARQHVQDSLSWLIDEGIASGVECKASYDERGFLMLEVTVTRSTNQRWANLWNAAAQMTFPAPGTVLKLFIR